ncbi:MAG: phosphoribosylamine--glycine ligase [Ilumatobacteraceae bacterium]
MGSGGREHALAWKIDQSDRCGQLFVTPGNAGTPGTRLAFAPTDVTGITRFCVSNRVDLVIIGPESALEVGLADALTDAGITVFGPSRAASRMEWSKAYAREIATQLGIPSPRHASFTEVDEALGWWRRFEGPIVVKLAGLAAGKGVIVPESDEETEAAIRRLIARGEIVLEERLTGPECSLLAMCDGVTSVALPIAQDHKRIHEGDTGPNTGGMGAYAPAPIPYTAQELQATFVQPVLDRLAKDGTPYVGVLFAGLMLTADGPRLIEYNCRFGDPEAQAVLPLLESDLMDVVLACCRGALGDLEVSISPGAACAVVASTSGYPGSPNLGHSITFGATDALVFHAGTAYGDDDSIVTAAGRVLAVTGLGPDLQAARDAAYEAMATITFHGKHVRRDIGWRAPGATLTSYASAGVDIDEGNLAVQRLKASVDRTHTAAVLNGIGSFGGAMDVSALKDLDQPVLVASTDGVGTKVELAARAGRPGVAGMDIVNHCVDDVLVQGARPLFFLDYIAAATIDSGLIAAVVEGMAAACEANGCALLGGETAEMPGVYLDGAFDVAGTLVGVVDRADMLPRPGIAAGDVLVGLGSSGPHTNGYLAAAEAVRGIRSPPNRRRSTVRSATPSSSRTVPTCRRWSRSSTIPVSKPWPTSPAAG